MSTATKQAARPQRKRAERTWLACFQFDEPALPDAPRPNGHFQIVVKATTPNKALDLCRARLRELRATTSMFDTPCTIYLDHLIAISDVGEKPTLVNYTHAMFFEGGGQGEILCGLPEQPDVHLDVFVTNQKEDEPTPAFLDFGGEHANELLRQAVQRPAPAPYPPPPTRGRRRGPR